LASPALATHTGDKHTQCTYPTHTRHTAGNLVSKSGLDLSQVSGFTVVAEKLNFFRYISHFRCAAVCVRGGGGLCGLHAVAT
jgi:hypothetical protein